MHRDVLVGIYKIENHVNGKIYIGSSCNIKNRFSTHYRQLCMGTHDNPKLQASWNKYGEMNFSFSTLELCKNEERLEREQWYIDTLHPFFNIAKEVGFPSTPKAGTSEAMERYLKTRESIQKNGTYESEEYREMMSGIMFERWKNKDYKESRSSDTKNLWENKEYRAKQKESHRKLNSLERSYILKLIEMGFKKRHIAKRFNVHEATIRRISLGLH